ncbi:hypothetical protein HN51_015120 [Arachis hypogaea]
MDNILVSLIGRIDSERWTMHDSVQVATTTEDEGRATTTTHRDIREAKGDVVRREQETNSSIDTRKGDEMEAQ